MALRGTSTTVLRSADRESALGGARQETREVHRLRDLDRPGRLTAMVFAGVLVLPPILALFHYWSDWFPMGDPALMAFRALDVGTSRTPIIGQPSLSGEYVDDHLVHHLGAIHFYLLAPFVRLFGVHYGMMFVSVLMGGGSLLISAWALFRQLGLRRAIWASVVVGLVAFTTGASPFVLPVSSSIAGYPYFCSIILLWCLLCGDLKLLPLTVTVVSFTAMQHLSVLPSLCVATIAVVVGYLIKLRFVTPEAERPSRRDLTRWGVGAAIVAAVLWAPLLLQNVFGNRPNLTALLDFTVSSDRPKLGYSVALRHVTHVLGLPPMLGRLEIPVGWMFTKLSPLTTVSAALVLVMLAFAVWHWRSSKPQQSMLAVMGLVMTLAGLIGSATVPRGEEENRLVFYHWVFPLAAIVLLVAGLLAGDVVARWKVVQPSWQPALTGIAAALIVVPSGINPWLDRWPNSLEAAYPPFEREVLENFADKVMEQRDQLDGNVVLIGRDTARGGLDAAVALELEMRGLSLKHAGYQGVFVDGERQISRPNVDKGLVLVLDTDVPFTGRPELPEVGELIAEEDVPGGVAMFANFDHRTSDREPASLKCYLLERDVLLQYATRDELPERLGE